MPEDRPPRPEPKRVPKPRDAALPDRAMGELAEIAKRAKAAIQEPPQEIAAERSGQLSPPHTPGRRRK